MRQMPPEWGPHARTWMCFPRSTYDDPADDAALATLADAFPGRTVTPVDARTLFALGGGVHCITQQEPLVEAPCAP